MSARLLFLEIDAGDKFLIQDWAASGVLPTFRDLLSRALVGDTMSLEGLFVGATWPSLYTGVNPARHGIHSLLQLVPGTYQFRHHPTGEALKCEPFWRPFSRAGKRLAILDIPLSGIDTKINGIQSVEWGAHDANYGFCAWPPAFETDIRTRFGAHPFTRSCNGLSGTPDGFIAFRDALIAGVNKKAELTRHYLASERWDLFAQVFTESHCVGHQCWHLHDNRHPGHDPEVVALTGDPMREIYIAIDRAIGEIIRAAGNEAVIIVLAGHRMSHKRGAQFLLPHVLARLGVASLRTSAPPDAVDRLDAVLAAGWRRVPDSVKELLAPLRKRVRAQFDSRKASLPPSIAALDLARSQCFLMDIGYPVAGLRLNLKGREPAGMLERGAEADAFCRALARDLLELRDDASGVPMVTSVKRTVDLYAGEYLDLLPDLLVEWSDELILGSAGCGSPAGSLVRIRSPKTGLVEGVNRYCRTGDHRPEGMFFALAPGLKPRRVARTVSLMDFAPTFAELLGVALPDVDGRPITELTEAHSAG